MDCARLLSEHIHNINNLSDLDVAALRNILLDFYAAMFAGYKQNKTFADGVGNVVLAQGGKEEASVYLQSSLYPARTAAFMNALYGHGAELDDGNKKAMGHPGVHIIPAVLALAEAENKSEREVLVALACGYETFIRISMAAQPGMVERSIHSTGYAGAPACAVACAKLLGLDATGIEDAMSLSCTMASGLLTYSESRQNIKPINPAKAAETGVFAARLAQAGVHGPLNCLEGPNGWLKAATDKVNEEAFVFEGEDNLLMHECYFKLYPSCRHTHCGIEAAINIFNKKHQGEIKKVEVRIYPNAIKLAGQIKYPVDADETKFSIHYTLACGLLFGEYGVDYMNPPLLNDKVKMLIDKIELIPDKAMEDSEKGIRGASVIVKYCDGTSVTETVLVPKGDPEKPLTHEDIILKLKTCAKGIATDKQIYDLISYLEQFGSEKPLNASTLFMKE